MRRGGMDQNGCAKPPDARRWRGEAGGGQGARRRPRHGRHAAPCVLAGEDDKEEEVGWAGWGGGPRPWREVSFSFFLCLIFPFFF